MQDEEKYDLIISNPPFYSADYSSGDAKRDQARFAEALPFDELLEGVSLLLSKRGKFAVVIPFSEEENFLKLARQFDLFPRRITRVKGTPESPVKRSLLEMSFLDTGLVEQELIIETSRHRYTPEYIELVKDFYLKM